MEELIHYNGYEIAKNIYEDGFFVSMPDVFTGKMYFQTLEQAKSFIDYVSKNRDRWVV